MSFIKSTLASLIGSILAGLIFLFLLVMLVGGLVSGQQDEIRIPKKSFLYLDLSKSIRETEDESPFRTTGLLNVPEFGTAPGLYQIRQSLREAAGDDRIAGIYLRTRSTNSRWATLEALRDELILFKSSGKPIFAWADGYSEGSYFLASVADHVYLHPFGSLELNGFAATPYYLRGLLDKIGISPRIFRVGTYKSAIEPYRDYQMSEASREQMGALLEDFWQTFSNGVVGQRKGTTLERLDQLAASARTLVEPELPAREKLVDALKYEYEVRDEMRQAAGLEAGDDLELVSLSKYIDAVTGKEPVGKSEDKVAVVFMEGDIVGGKGENGEIGGDRYAKIIRELRGDSTVKAVVLRINSPGGSALASDLIWAEIEATRQVKPIVASMGDLAASGGYYIAAPCSYIFARPTTITGSIGVFSLMFATQELTEEKMGVNFDRVVTHPMADLGNPNRELSEAEDALMQQGVNRTYGRFIGLVQRGRNFPDSLAVDSIAQGRVWSGQRALQLGLVDEMGGLEEAIAYAALQAGLDDFKRKLLPEPTDPLQKWLNSFANLGLDASLLSPELAREVERLRTAQLNKWKPGLYLRMTEEFDIH